jgi:hypothetical protein
MDCTEDEYVRGKARKTDSQRDLIQGYEKDDEIDNHRHYILDVRLGVFWCHQHVSTMAVSGGVI